MPDSYWPLMQESNYEILEADVSVQILIGLVDIGAALRCARTTSKYDQPNDSTGEVNLYRPGVKSSPCWVTTKNCRTATTKSYGRNTRVEHVQVRVAPGLRCLAVGII